MSYPTIFPELSTERLTLRQLSLKDRRAIFKLRSNKEINKLIVRKTPKNLSDADAFIQTCLDDFETEYCIYWAIEAESTKQIIGTISFNKISLETNYVEVGYELNPDFQKNGFMDEAMKAVLEYGASTMKLETIEAFTHKDNSDSIALLEKNNFVYQPDLKDPGFENNSVFAFKINQE